jgi:hypothetical protein
LVQITNSRPRRRTILQFSQIRFTLARTFMTYLNPDSFALRRMLKKPSF